jgi:hypothetical protein
MRPAPIIYPPVWRQLFKIEAMTPAACPHCGTTIVQTRKDSRCVACGKQLREGLAAPPANAALPSDVFELFGLPEGARPEPGRSPFDGGDIRSFPILDVGGRAPLLIAPLPGQSSPPTVNDKTSGRLPPLHGIEHVVPWPIIRLPPGASVMSFWGSGDQTTQAFVLHGDASLRIVIERGLLFLRVLCPDGREVGHQTTMPGPGLAIDDIPIAGTFMLEVRASGRWAITVIYASAP